MTTSCGRQRREETQVPAYRSRRSRLMQSTGGSGTMIQMERNKCHMKAAKRRRLIRGEARFAFRKRKQLTSSAGRAEGSQVIGDRLPGRRLAFPGQSPAVKDHGIRSKTGSYYLTHSPVLERCQPAFIPGAAAKSPNGSAGYFLARKRRLDATARDRPRFPPRGPHCDLAGGDESHRPGSDQPGKPD